jgi:tetratricopeptide (TPR) repeat protein
MYQGRFDDAITDFSRALEHNPEIAWAYFNRGLSWVIRGDETRAQADFERCIALKPELREDLLKRAELARELRGKDPTIKIDLSRVPTH